MGTTDSGRCPSPGELEAFAVGDLEDERFERVASHVEACRACEGVLARIDGRGDELVDGLRRLSGDDSSSNGVPERLVEAARRAGSGSELVVDPGRKLARALADGPQRLGKFELVEAVGVGSFGYVFRARDTELDRTVAIKVERAGLSESPFLREARSVAQLRHPHIVALYETGETEDGAAYLVTEFIDGETLEERMRRPPPLGFDESARLVEQVADALAEAHEHGIVHRDIKPSNVMLDRAGEPHLMDFGLAKREVGEVTITPDGAMVGTPAYMSPEVARGDAHSADARSDVYSLGVVLYELLTGERPFRGNRRMLVLQVLEGEPTPPRKLEHKVPRDLETICLKAMEKSPARRYVDARVLARDLARFRRGEEIEARSLRLAERLVRWCRRNPIAAGLFVAITIGSAFGFWHLSQLSHELVENSAVVSAAQYADMLEVVNEFYSSEVVERAGEHGVQATADYALHEGSIPLPATMLTQLLECISQGESGMKGRHYSEYPFKSRKDGGPRTAFEREALDWLKEHPDEPYLRFARADGRPALFYATARRMQASCVACHNNHPDSTKRDWKVGDVRGVLAIVRPLDLDVARTREGLRGSFVLFGAVSLAALGISAAIVVVLNRRRLATLGKGGP